MKNLQKYLPFLIIGVMILVSFQENKIWLQCFGLFTPLGFIFNSFKSLFALKHKKIVEAKIVNFKPNGVYELEDNVNSDLEIQIFLPDDKIQTANIRALYFKSPRMGKRVKITLNEENINDSEIYTGTEYIQYLNQIVICLVMSISMLLLIFKKI